MRKTFAVIALLGLGLVWLSGRADAQHRADHPITICHYDGSDEHGGSGKYTQISVDTSSTDLHGHEGHTHDIIPPTSDDGTIEVTAKNWDTAGQAIWENQCVSPTTSTTTSTAVTTSTVEPSTTSTSAPSSTTSTTIGVTTTTVTPTPSSTVPGRSSTGTSLPSSTTSSTVTPRVPPTVATSLPKTGAASEALAIIGGLLFACGTLMLAYGLGRRRW